MSLTRSNEVNFDAERGDTFVITGDHRDDSDR